MKYAASIQTRTVQIVNCIFLIIEFIKIIGLQNQLPVGFGTRISNF